MTDVTTHRAAVAEIERAYAAIPPGSRVRLAKSTSNLFRFRDGSQRNFVPMADAVAEIVSYVASRDNRDPTAVAAE